jgi:hypothetical protein
MSRNAPYAGGERAATAHVTTVVSPLSWGAKTITA